MLRAVARSGSLSAAARHLGYTQPAVSHHVARLEAEVGTALLTRLGRGVQLTDAGLALVEHADAVLSRLEAAEEDVAAIAGLRAGRVRLAAFPSASATLMAGALTRLRAEHPGVAASFVEAEPEDALPLLRAGELDLALAFSYPAVGERDGRDLATVPLLHDPSLAVGPAGHPAAAGGAAGRRPPAGPGAPRPVMGGGGRRPSGRRRRAAGAPGRAGGGDVDRRVRALPPAPAAYRGGGRIHAPDRVRHRRLHDGPVAHRRRPRRLAAAGARAARRAAAGRCRAAGGRRSGAHRRGAAARRRAAATGGHRDARCAARRGG